MVSVSTLPDKSYGRSSVLAASTLLSRTNGKIIDHDMHLSHANETVRIRGDEDAARIEQINQQLQAGLGAARSHMNAVILGLGARMYVR